MEVVKMLVVKWRNMYIANAFSLSMIREDKAGEQNALLEVRDLGKNISKVKKLIENSENVVSAVGHESTAKLLSELLKMEIKADRKSIKIRHGDGVIVFQLIQRLPEGKILSTEELQNLDFKFFLVSIVDAREIG